jgi:hypothetical protein
MVKVNNRSKGNNRYNKRIADLVMSDWSAYRIYRHLMIDEKATYDNEPISLPTIQRRVKLYNDNRADMQRFYDNEMTEAERNVFMRRMKLTNK